MSNEWKTYRKELRDLPAKSSPSLDENNELKHCHPYIHKLIPYNDQMENFRGLQGVGDHKGYFDIVLQPYITTQRTPTYSRNGEDRVVYKDLKYQ